MKAFDLIDSTSFGYKIVWQERRYLMKLALVPVLIKLACTVVIFSFGFEGLYLRQGLVTLPASFAEGWLLAQFLRTLLLLERWPIYLKEEPSDKMMNALLLRAQGIMSSTILYALITFLAYGLKALYALLLAMAGGGTPDNPTPPTAANSDQDSNPLFLIPALGLIYLSLWIFRFLWLYIPASVLMPMGAFLKQIGGFMTPLRMLGVFLVSMVPCFLVAIILSNVLTAFVGGPDTNVGRFVMMIISVLVETVISLITTASMTYALKNFLPHHPAALQDNDKR